MKFESESFPVQSLLQKSSTFTNTDNILVFAVTRFWALILLKLLVLLCFIMRMIRVGFSGLDFFLLELTVELDGCKCFPSLTSLMDQFRPSATLFHGNRRLITAFAPACHLSLSWATWMQSIPPTSIYLRCTLILNFLYARATKWPLSFGCPIKTVYAFFFLCVWRMPHPYHPPCPTHIILLSQPISSSYHTIWWVVQIMTTLITQFLQHPVWPTYFPE